MKISAKVDYASRALLELALKWPDKHPVRIQAIAERQRIPIKFLTHILINLKELKCVRSVRGKNGGYVLTRAPADIRLSEIVTHFGGGIIYDNDQASGRSKHILHLIWSEVEASILKELNRITLEDICDRSRTLNQTLTFEI